MSGAGWRLFVCCSVPKSPSPYCAITPGDRPAEESFEATAAFAWLGEYAGRHGFGLSYPRGNPHGIVYEPWHWRFHAAP